MIGRSGKALWPASIVLCIVLGTPNRAIAQKNTTSRFEILKISARSAVPEASPNPVRAGATPGAQLPDAQYLDEEEIAALSQRNQDPGPQVSGGALSNEHLTYVVIALAAIVLVLVLH